MSISRRDFFKRSLVAGAGAAAATMIGPFALEAEAKKGKVRIPKARRVIVMTFDGIRVSERLVVSFIMEISTPLSQRVPLRI